MRPSIETPRPTGWWATRVVSAVCIILVRLSPRAGRTFGRRDFNQAGPNSHAQAWVAPHVPSVWKSKDDGGVRAGASDFLSPFDSFHQLQIS